MCTTMIFNNKVKQLFHLLVCMFKFVFLLAVFVYLFKNSAAKHRVNAFYGIDEANIKDRRILKQSIALLLGFVLEGVGIFGAAYRMWKCTLVYLLLNLLVVPLYLYHAKLHKYWFVDVISLISTIIFIFMLYVNHEEKELAHEREEVSAVAASVAAAKRAQQRRSESKERTTPEVSRSINVNVNMTPPVEQSYQQFPAQPTVQMIQIPAQSFPMHQLSVQSPPLTNSPSVPLTYQPPPPPPYNQ